MKKTLFIAALVFCSATHAQTSYLWQHSDVKNAWNQGFKGQGVKITVHDEDNQKIMNANLNFQNRWDPYLNFNRTNMSHAEAVRQVAQLTAPDAQVEKKQWDNGTIVLDPNKFNVVNASYGWVGGTDAGSVAYAKNLQLARIAYDGTGVVVKAAGNNNAILSNDGGGDGINMALKSAGSVIFAGALSSHGTEVKTYQYRRWSYTIGGAQRAYYSNKPGTDTEYQKRYLMVGVNRDQMTIAGTSFAAPQISAYAAIVSSKFTGAQPAAVVSQLLNTARTDTIRNYNPEEHGRGEASLSRALSPRSIQ
jgi:hypothetical protein